jgi:ribonuclease P protein subunit RPR2
MSLGRRRISQNDIETIAKERMERLMTLSAEQAMYGDIDLARRYVDLARRIGMRTRTKIPGKYIYCKNCLAPMTPGTFRVRLKNRKVIMRCTECGSIKRIPYVKEQRK